MPITVAVDANGADLGPAEVAAGAADAAQQGVRVVLFGPAEEFGEVGRGDRGRRRPRLHRQGARPRACQPRDPRRLDRPRHHARSPRATPTPSSAAARPAPRWPPRLFNIKRATGIHRPALAIPVPGPRAPGHDRRRRRQRRGAPRAPRPVRLHGRRAGPGRARHRAPARRPALQRRGGHARARRWSSRRTPRCATAWPRAAPSTSSATSRATRSPSGKADVVVTDGFTGNIALKLIEGVSEEMLRQIRDVAMSSRARQGRRPAAAPGAARVARGDRPRERRRRLPAGAAPARRGAPRALQPPRLRAGDPARRARRSRATSSGAPTPRWRPRTRCAPARLSGSPLLRLPRHDPRRGLQPDPAHLADELEVDPARIDESTRFKEDLEADSLDLYTLVQELEDTYGVKMSDEQAARILSVGQAVDFVVAHAPTTS